MYRAFTESDNQVKITNEEEKGYSNSNWRSQKISSTQ